MAPEEVVELFWITSRTDRAICVLADDEIGILFGARFERPKTGLLALACPDNELAQQARESRASPAVLRVSYRNRKEVISAFHRNVSEILRYIAEIDVKKPNEIETEYSGGLLRIQELTEFHGA